MHSLVDLEIVRNEELLSGANQLDKRHISGKLSLTRFIRGKPLSLRDREGPYPLIFFKRATNLLPRQLTSNPFKARTENDSLIELQYCTLARLKSPIDCQ